MRFLLFSRKFLLFIASALAFSLLFLSVVYACSGLDSMQIASRHAAMDNMDKGMVERGPCSEHKQDICKSVRHRMLSSQASSYQVETPLHGSTLSQEVSIEGYSLPGVSPSHLPLHPLVNLSLTYSDLVLRI